MASNGQAARALQPRHHTHLALRLVGNLLAGTVLATWPGGPPPTRWRGILQSEPPRLGEAEVGRAPDMPLAICNVDICDDADETPGERAML